MDKIEIISDGKKLTLEMEMGTYRELMDIYKAIAEFFTFSSAGMMRFIHDTVEEEDYVDKKVKDNN